MQPNRSKMVLKCCLQILNFLIMIISSKSKSCTTSNLLEGINVPRRPCCFFVPPIKYSYLCGPIFHPTSPQPCVATTDATGDLTWVKSSSKSRASLKPTSSSSPPLPPGALVAQADRDCVKRKLLSRLNCTVPRWIPTVHPRSPHLQKMEETTGTDTQGSS